MAAVTASGEEQGRHGAALQGHNWAHPERTSPVMDTLSTEQNLYQNCFITV